MRSEGEKKKGRTTGLNREFMPACNAARRMYVTIDITIREKKKNRDY